VPKLVVRAFAMSIDGFSAAKGQTLQEPFGRGGRRVMGWAFPTRTMRQKVFGQEGGTEGIDNDFLAHADDNIGATIMGRNMFGPVRCPWENEDWKGWWGETPPYHHPVFVLSHHPRAAFDMKGGTSFTFVTDGIESALKQAFAAAKGQDVRIGGGASTVRQYLKAGLVDELHLVQVPILLGQGERVFEGLDGIEERYECVEFKPSEAVAHVRLRKKA
jgi:dihydrofolate reductase